LSGKYVHQLNVKLSTILKEDLEKLAESLGVKPSELVRSWITEKVQESRKRPGRPKVRVD
jgi:hypothetical protein